MAGYTMYKKQGSEFARFFDKKEGIAVFALFKRATRAKEQRVKELIPNPEQSQNVWYKSSFQLSLQNGGRPTLNKSESLLCSKK